mmetsp:Transcript_4526/g.6807  ORF Transcript_4526/g.6807 Transcript_4526/m.6807 type:complete len:114 (-) Transcript_4526:163-504(-)
MGSETSKIQKILKEHQITRETVVNSALLQNLAEEVEKGSASSQFPSLKFFIFQLCKELKVHLTTEQKRIVENYCDNGNYQAADFQQFFLPLKDECRNPYRFLKKVFQTLNCSR